MKIIHVQAAFSLEHGGPAHSLRNYCVRQAKNGHEVAVWALDGFRNSSPAIRMPGGITTIAAPVDQPRFLGGSVGMRKLLRNAKSPDLYHIHGAWHLANSDAAKEALRRRIPYILELMGHYEPYGLHVKWFRKRIARWLYQDDVLRCAACLHVNSPEEAKNVRALGFAAPIVVLPVGVDTDAIEANSRSSRAESPWPELRETPFALFLARIHEKKGIETLLRAWASLGSARRERVLAVCGAGEPEYVARCRSLAERLGLEGSCMWLGQVSESEKAWAYANADVYVLPSFSENYGNSVAEALAYGRPVITTNATPWMSIVEKRCGWIVDPGDVGALASALQSSLAQSDEERLEVGRRGLEWSRNEFSLTSVIEKLDETYRWLLGGGRPDFVI